VVLVVVVVRQKRSWYSHYGLRTATTVGVFPPSESLLGSGSPTVEVRSRGGAALAGRRRSRRRGLRL